MRRFSIAAFACTLVFAASMMLLPGASGPIKAPNTEVETWKLDPVHCMALFRVQHMGAGQFWGRFNEITGTAEYARDDSKAPVFDVM